MVRFTLPSALALAVLCSACGGSSGSTTATSQAPQPAADLAALDGAWIGTVENPKVVGKWGKLADVDVTIAVNPEGRVVASYEIPAQLENGAYTAQPALVGEVRFRCNDQYCEPINPQGGMTGPYRLVVDAGAVRLTSLIPGSGPDLLQTCAGTSPEGIGVFKPAGKGYRVTQEYASATGDGCGYGVGFTYDVVLRPAAG